MSKLTAEQIERNRKLMLGREDIRADSMRIELAQLADVHVGDQVQYHGHNHGYYGNTGTVVALIGSGALGVHFPHHAAGANVTENIGQFRLTECVHQQPLRLETEDLILVEGQPLTVRQLKVIAAMDEAPTEASSSTTL